MKLPNNAVTRMPIEAQQREADLIRNSIKKLEQQLEKEREWLKERLLWIELAQRG
tara:strand:+ start:33 stop:197 length:165 start_codon:yes stop_codon:yes gene_type:complete